MVIKTGTKVAGEQWLALGGLFGALTASSCCILPLVLFSLGISGAWIGNFTQLAPYKPFFIAATVVFLGTGYWRVYRKQMPHAPTARPVRDLSRTGL